MSVSIMVPSIGSCFRKRIVLRPKDAKRMKADIFTAGPAPVSISLALIIAYVGRSGKGGGGLLRKKSKKPLTNHMTGAIINKRWGESPGGVSRYGGIGRRVWFRSI